MYQRRLVGLLLSGAAVILMLTSVLTKMWWGSGEPNRSVSVGLRSAEVCEKVSRSSSSDDRGAPDPDAYRVRPPDYDDDNDRPRPRRERSRTDCVDQGIRGYLEDEQDRADDQTLYDPDAPGAAAIPSAFIRLGAVAFAFGILAALAVAAGAAMVLFPRAPKHRSAGTIVALVCAAFAGVSLAFVVAAPSGLGGGLRAGPGVILALLGAGAGVAGALILQRLDAATEPATRTLTEATKLTQVGRAPAWIAGAIGAGLIGAALFTHTWFHGEHGDASIGIGLREVENCDREVSYDDRDRGRETCVTATVPARFDGAEQPTKMKVFVSTGNLAWLLGLAAIGVALACGGLAALQQPIGGRFAAWRIQLGVAAAFALAAVVYTASRPAEVSDVGISFGPVLAIGGAGCLVGGAIMLGRWVTAMQQAVTQVPQHVAQEISQPVMIPQFHHGLGAPMPPPSPFVMPAPQAMSPFAPPGAMPSSPFAPPTAPSPFAAPTVVSPFAPPYAAAAAPAPSPYAQPAQMPIAAPVPMPVVAQPVAPTFGMAFAPPAQMQAIPPCPQCTTPMLWVSAKNSWMCTVCRGRS